MSWEMMPRLTVGCSLAGNLLRGYDFFALRQILSNVRGDPQAHHCRSIKPCRSSRRECRSRESTDRSVLFPKPGDVGAALHEAPGVPLGVDHLEYADTIELVLGGSA